MYRMPTITNNYNPAARAQGFNVGRKQALDVQHGRQNAKLGSFLAKGDLNQTSNKAFEMGRLGEGLEIKSMHDKQAQAKDQAIKDHMVKVAYLSDTPEKWDSMINGLKRRGIDMPQEYSDFRSRNSVLAEYGDIDTIRGLFRDRRADETLDLQRQKLAFDRARGSYALDDRLKQLKLRELERKVLGSDNLEKEKNITSGIENLAKIPQWAKQHNRDFDGAIGPFDNSIVGRAMGVLDTSEGEVRRKIEGDTEALAAAIKPLIRKPGEGVWTDKDQERLVAVVGDLVKARDTAEYRRALQGVRDRVNANFGMNLPRLSFEQPKANSRIDLFKGKVTEAQYEKAINALKKGVPEIEVLKRLRELAVGGSR